MILIVKIKFLRKIQNINKMDLINVHIIDQYKMDKNLYMKI